MRFASPFAVCVLALSAVAADPPAVAPTRPGSDWPKFLGPAGDGSSPETGFPTPWPKDGLRKVWDCSLGLGYAPPTVAAGRLFHFDRVGKNARVTARNAETGAVLWTYENPTAYEDLYGYDPGPRACPVVDGDRVYAYGVDGVLVCLTSATGKEVWKCDTKEKYHVHQNFFGVASVPVVDGDLLIVAVGGSPPGSRPADLREAKPAGTCVVAFDKATGAVRYAVGDDLASYSSPGIYLIDGKKVALYFARGGLLGFEPRSGKQLFHYPWRARPHDSVNAANPVVVGNTILITECYEKGSACLKWADGKLTEVWTDGDKPRGEQSLIAHWSTPIYHDGHVYGNSGRHPTDADLRCVELATGDVKWTERRTTRCTLTKVDGRLLCLAETGELRVLKPNPAKYDEVARWEVPELSYPSWAPPVVSRGLVYLRGKDETNRDGHRLVCFELAAKK